MLLFYIGKTKSKNTMISTLHNHFSLHFSLPYYKQVFTPFQSCIQLKFRLNNSKLIYQFFYIISMCPFCCLLHSNIIDRMQLLQPSYLKKEFMSIKYNDGYFNGKILSDTNKYDNDYLFKPMEVYAISFNH